MAQSNTLASLDAEKTYWVARLNKLRLKLTNLREDVADLEKCIAIAEREVDYCDDKINEATYPTEG